MQITGHRGAGGLAPENTIASLLKGIEHGVDEVELDVRVCKDGIVVGHHNASIVDASGSRCSISAHTFAKLQRHKPNLATLEDALSAINRRVPLVIEIKPGEPVSPIVAIIKQRFSMGWQPQDILVASFSQRILHEMQDALPELEIIINERWSGIRAIHRARQLGTWRISMNKRWLWSGFIRYMQRSGYQLSAYTLNDPHKARRWAHFGLYGAITDYPDRYSGPAA